MQMPARSVVWHSLLSVTIAMLSAMLLPSVAAAEGRCGDGSRIAFMEAAMAHAVFHGTVRDIRPWPLGGDNRQVEFETHRFWKGRESPTLLLVTPETEGAVDFEVGEAYIVYARLVRREGERVLFAWDSSRVLPFCQAEVDDLHCPVTEPTISKGVAIMQLMNFLGRDTGGDDPIVGQAWSMTQCEEWLQNGRTGWMRRDDHAPIYRVRIVGERICQEEVPPPPPVVEGAWHNAIVGTVSGTEPQWLSAGCAEWPWPVRSVLYVPYGGS